MTPKTTIESTLLPEIFELISHQGLNGTIQVMARLFNEAMKIERAQALGAQPYERTRDRGMLTALRTRPCRPVWEQ